jgi:hypothetical protein
MEYWEFIEENCFNREYEILFFDRDNVEIDRKV